MFARVSLLSVFLGSVSLAAHADVPQVIADTPIAQSMAALVMGELGEPGVLLGAGADPHHFQMRPSQARALSRADLILWTSPELTGWLARPVESLADGTVLQLDEAPGMMLRPFAEHALMNDDHDDDHGDDHEDTRAHEAGHEEEHGHAEEQAHDEHAHEEHGHDDEHAHGDIDPHFWLDPANLAPAIRAIAEQLALLDPANAATYRTNAENAAQMAQALQAEMTEILAPVGDAGLVMVHNAYGYLAHAFDLNIAGTIRDGDAVAPGASHLRQLREGLEQAGVVCLFPEANHNAAGVAVVAEGTDLRIGQALDPAGVLLDGGADLWATTLRALAETIAACVRGS